MINDSVLQTFVRALAANKHVERGAIARFPREANVPVDVARVLEQIGGWRYADLRFTAPDELAQDRALLDRLVDDFEAERSTNWNHAFWNRAWFPLALSSIEVHAYDPVGCFGGPPHQVVAFDFKGGDSWHVYSSLSAWLSALTEGLEAEPGNAVSAAHRWAVANKTCVDVLLPEELEQQRSPQRFEAPVVAWTVMRHPDGRCWAIREQRDGYELRIGDGDDAVTRKRKASDPTVEVRRLVREQELDGFEHST